MLQLFAVISASLTMAFAWFLAWPLSELGQAGRPGLTALAALLVFSTSATLFVVAMGLEQWLGITLVPPSVMLGLVLHDRSVLWGNFPPARRGSRAAQRVAAVGVFAIPAALAWAAA